MGWWSRHRHKRGFGVHSPFAFRCVSDCLCERMRYCDYARVPKDQWLLYRLAAWLQPRTTSAVGTSDASAALLACPDRPDRPAAPWVGLNAVDLVVADAKDGISEAVAAVGQGAAAYVTNCDKAALEALRGAIDVAGYGQTFANHSGTVIALPFPGLWPEHYEVAF